MDDPRPMLHRAGAVAQGLIDAVRPEQLDGPTPCADWTVRQLLGHMVNGNQRFAATVTGQPGPERVEDLGGAEPSAAFRDSFGAFAAAVGDDAVLGRTFATPLGDGPGAQLVGMRAIELTVHSWDLAAATGQSRELDPQLVAFADRTMRALPLPRAAAGPFGAEQGAPDGAGAADRLAAYLGRVVPASA